MPFDRMYHAVICTYTSRFSTDEQVMLIGPDPEDDHAAEALVEKWARKAAEANSPWITSAYRAALVRVSELAEDEPILPQLAEYNSTDPLV